MRSCLFFTQLEKLNSLHRDIYGFMSKWCGWNYAENQHFNNMKVSPLLSSALKDRPPPIIRQGPSNQTQAVGGMALFRCQASGDPEPSVTWRKNGVSLLGKDPRFSLLEHGNLQIQNTRVGDQHTLMMTPQWLSGLIVLHRSITAFNLLTSEARRKWFISFVDIGPLRNQTTP